MNKIALIVTTIKKDQIMLKCIPSFDKYGIVIYLLDQGDITPQKQMFYKTLEEKGHHIYCIKKDFGLSGARNFLLTKVTEPYIMISDDDVEIMSNPYDCLHHFDNKNIGIVGGKLIAVSNKKEQHYEYALEIKNKALYLKTSPKIDIVLNFFIAKKELFNDIQWDENLQLVEHSDFFLRLKQLNKWEVIYDEKLCGNHYSYELRPKDYANLRTKKINIYMAIFRKKWNILTTRRES